jgi:RNA polymerase sigma factor (sigma-70 family)
MIGPGLTDGELFRLVAWALAGYRRDPEWDDLFQEGLIGGWKAAQGAATKRAAQTRIVHAARWAACAYRRLSPNRRAREAVGLEEWRGMTADFSDRVLAAFERRRLCRQALAAMSERERRYVVLWIGQGLRQEEIGAADDIHPQRVSTVIQRGLKKARQRLGEGAADG